MENLELLDNDKVKKSKDMFSRFRTTDERESHPDQQTPSHGIGRAAKEGVTLRSHRWFSQFVFL